MPILSCPVGLELVGLSLVWFLTYTFTQTTKLLLIDSPGPHSLWNYHSGSLCLLCCLLSGLMHVGWGKRIYEHFYLNLLLFFNFYFYFILLYNTILVLPYIDMNPPRVYLSSQTWISLPPPTPYHLSGSSPCTSPKHPVSCIKHRLAIHDSIHVSMPFSQIIPSSPSPTESKSPLYTSVSLLLSSIQGHHYHHSKFHIYVLIYCIGVFISGLLHSV